MRAPSFWWQSKPTLLARLLSPLGWLYGCITASRMGREGRKADCPVICIGNWTAGGAGKTPVALAIAALLKQHGWHPVFLSRGYGGKLAGPLQVDPTVHGPDDCGDEPLLLARCAPAIIARDRVAGAQWAARLGNIIIMDDGLQNPALQKTLSFAVVDGTVGVGNGLCLPAGPLRAPVAAQWPHTDAMIVISHDRTPSHTSKTMPKPVFVGHLQPDPTIADALAGQAVLVVAGIGRPEKVLQTLQHLGAGPCTLRAFADHHPFTRQEIENLIGESLTINARLVTTSKDHVRITACAPDLAEHFTILPVMFVPQNEQALLAFIVKACGLEKGVTADHNSSGDGGGLDPATH